MTRIAVEGSAESPAPRARVWERLTDIAFVASCIGALESVRDLGGGRAEAVAVVRLGAMPVRLRIDATFEPLRAGETARVTVRGRAFGTSMNAESVVTLADAGPSRTQVRWSGTAQASGLLSAVGTDTLDAAVRKALDDFWRRFGERAAEGAGAD